MMNAGKYRHLISIYSVTVVRDSAGFQSTKRTLVLKCHASIKTTKGITLIKNGSDFEKAMTNFTIRFPNTPINRDMQIEYKNKTYTIEYLNDINEEGVELEMQCKEITH